MRVGICGYPGSGKSTVFAALAPGGGSSKSGVTYGNIKVPDERIDRLAAIFSPKKKVYAEITFVDVGAGGGAGGAFPPDVLQHMRNADVLVHVVRSFYNPALELPTDPVRDRGLFDDELILIDLEIIERRADRWRRERRKGLDMQVNERCLAQLEAGLPLRILPLQPAERLTLQSVQLLSLKPIITLHNLSEERWEDPEWCHSRDRSKLGPNSYSMGICAQLEAELNELEPDERVEMLEDLGLTEPAAATFVQTAYQLLDLISFLTFGPDECRAWPVRRGSSARKAGGKVHSDIERGFIRAEVSQLEDLEALRTEAALRAAGKTRLEGKDYTVKDGDLIVFRFNV